MSICKDCLKSYASRQSLSNHRKRAHPTMKSQLSKKLKSKAQDKKRAQKVVDMIFDHQPEAQGTGTDDRMSTEDNANSSDAESSGLEDIEVPNDVEGRKSMLIDLFKKLYSRFNEDNIEMRNVTREILDELKERNCITDSEYTHIMTPLKKRMDLSLSEIIKSTIESKTEDDKTEVLRLLRAMNADKMAKKVMSLVKDYFEDVKTYKDETALENVLRLLSTLKDKVDALTVKIILKQIEATRNRVIEIFRRLTNGSEKCDNLNGLRSSNHITDEQYQKLSIAPDTLPSIQKLYWVKVCI